MMRMMIISFFCFCKCFSYLLTCFFGPKMVPKSSQNGPQIVPKWSQNRPKMAPKPAPKRDCHLDPLFPPILGRLGGLLGPSWTLLGTLMGQVGAKRGQDGAKLGPRWGQELPKLSQVEVKLRLGAILEATWRASSSEANIPWPLCRKMAPLPREIAPLLTCR